MTLQRRSLEATVCSEKMESKITYMLSIGVQNGLQLMKLKWFLLLNEKSVV